MVAARVRARGSADPGARGRGALARSLESGAESRGRSKVAPGAGRDFAAWGRWGRAACLLPTITEKGGCGQSANLGCLSPPAEKTVVIAERWNPTTYAVLWQVPRGSPGMLMGEEPPPVPSLLPLQTLSSLPTVLAPRRAPGESWTQVFM